MKRNYLYYLLTILLVAVSCEKDDVMVYTTTIETHLTYITNTTVYCGGIISSNGNPTIKEVGVEWCTTSDFESNVSRSLADNSQAKLERFLFKIADLKGGTQYYVRAYARNNYSTIYGQVLSFKTSDVVPPTYLFPVSAYQFVTFSKGNLQYHPTNNEWRFAENQTDYIGAANSNCSSSNNAWLDLFGWSTSASNFGVSIYTDNDYSGSFVDWGMNKIGNDAPNTWRTLTYNEWEYLLNNRPNASSLRGVAQVNGVNGLIFLPDNWTCPSGVTFKPGFQSNYGVDDYAAYQTFTADQWSQLEAAGAVFLPAAGDRDGSNVGFVQDRAFYWSATELYGSAYYLYFLSGAAYLDTRYSSHFGHSVRLVKDL